MTQEETRPHRNTNTGAGTGKSSCIQALSNFHDPTGKIYGLMEKRGKWNRLPLKWDGKSWKNPYKELPTVLAPLYISDHRHLILVRPIFLFLTAFYQGHGLWG